MLRSSFKKTILFVQIIALMICTSAFGSFSPVYGQTATTTAPTQSETLEDVLSDGDMLYVQALQDQRSALQQQAQELETARQIYSDSLEGLLNQKSNIEQQIALKQREIDLNSQIAQSLTIQIYQSDLAMIEAEQTMLLRRQTLLERFEVLRQKLRALSKGGNLTPLQMIFSSDSFESFLINYKMAQRITQADQEMLTSLENELADLQSQREQLHLRHGELENERKPYESAANDLEASKTDLLALHDEATAISNMLAANVAYYRAQYLQIAQQQSLLQQQITQIVGTYDTSGVVAPTVMSWPSPECTIITSSFKERWGKWHYGTDIASWGDSTGKSIVAAADGTVIFSGTDDSGYGNYVIIDHGYNVLGEHILTLYGHCDTLSAKVGDIVFGGQTVIATVGNTGRSTGPHLHFELLIDGTPTDAVAGGYLLTDGITIAG